MREPVAAQEHPTLALNDGRRIPQLGLGVWQVPENHTAGVVREAVAVGYRLIDTATIYGNEREVGEGARSAGVPRESLYVTTKLWNDRQGYDSALRAFDDSARRLALEYVDLYLIHWPAPRRNAYVDAWRALITLRDGGRVRSIGVSNFTAEHLRRVIGETGVVPAVNQIELHPRFQQKELRAFHEAQGIVTESWSPLAQGQLLDDPTVARIAWKYGRSAAQVIIRWHLDSGLVVIPKSSHPRRIRENGDVFGFRLDADDMAAIARLDREDGRVGAHPERMS